MNNMRNAMLCGACVALCAVFATAFPVGIHFALYLSVMLCCLTCPFSYAALCAVIAPFTSAVLTETVSGIQLASLTAECLAVSLVFSALIRALKTGKHRLSVCVIASSAAGRVINALVSALIFSHGEAALIWSGLNLLYILPELAVLIAYVKVIDSALSSAGLYYSERSGE